MKKAIEFQLVLICLCFPAYAQTTETCRAELRHLSLPAEAWVDSPSAKTPLYFLFSQDGIDVYSAVPFDLVGTVFDDGIRIVTVFQDERIRQKMIDAWKKPVGFGNWMVPLRHAPLANLKFSVVHFERAPVWVDDVLTRKWLVTDIRLFEPEACESISPELQYWERTGTDLRAAEQYRNWIASTIFPTQQRPSPGPVQTKSIQMIERLLKDLADLKQNR